MAIETTKVSPLVDLLKKALQRGAVHPEQHERIASDLARDVRHLLRDDLLPEQSRHLRKLREATGLQKGYVNGYEVGYDQAVFDLQSAGSLEGARARNLREE
jgi:hypothetical protein